MSGRSVSYNESLYRRLKDKDEAMHYLQAGLEDFQAVFLTCVKNVVESRAQAGAAHANPVDRAVIDQMPSEEYPLTLDGVEKILHTLGFKLTIALDQDVPSDITQRVDTQSIQSRSLRHRSAALRVEANRQPSLTETICPRPTF